MSCFADLNLAGALFIRYATEAGSGDFASHGICVVRPLAAADTLTFDVFHSSGANRNWTGRVDVYRVGP